MLQGAFCQACGERNPAGEDRSVGHFFREAAEEITSADSRSLRSLRLLVFHPGELTLEWIRGRRRGYVNPLKLYLVIFALVVVASSLVPQQDSNAAGANATLGEAQVEALQERIAERRGITPEAARRELNQRTVGAVTWTAIIGPFVLGAIIQLVFLRRRRWFAEHMVFATHFASFNNLIALVIIPIQLLASAANFDASMPLVLGASALVVVYLYLALRRVYDTSRVGAVLRSVVLVLGLSISQLLAGLLALCVAAAGLLYF